MYIYNLLGISSQEGFIIVNFVEKLFFLSYFEHCWNGVLLFAIAPIAIRCSIIARLRIRIEALSKNGLHTYEYMKRAEL